MDHLLTEQQLEVKKVIREFAEAEIHPTVAHRDDSKKRISRRHCREDGELGFIGMNTPESLGGAGMDTVVCAVVMKTVRVDPGPEYDE